MVMSFEDVKRIRENPTAEDVDNKELHRLIDIAIEKQIPKKPLGSLLTEYKFSWVCPNCKTRHVNEWCGTNLKLPYCSICGQALDWSDTE